MIFDTLQFLFAVPAGLLGSALLLRAYAQRIRLHPHNPLSQFLFRLTDWLVKPLRRAIPGAGGIDWASILGAWLTALLLVVLLLALRSMLAGAGLTLLPGLPTLAMLAVIKIAEWVIAMAMLFILLAALLSWFQLSSPLAYVINDLVKPLLQPIQRRLPLSGGLDFSPLIVLFLLMVAQRMVESAGAYLTPVGTLIR